MLLDFLKNILAKFEDSKEINNQIVFLFLLVLNDRIESFEKLLVQFLEKINEQPTLKAIKNYVVKTIITSGNKPYNENATDTIIKEMIKQLSQGFKLLCKQQIDTLKSKKNTS